MQFDREEVLKVLTALDFMAVDMGLYLDTHPDDKSAIEIYNEILKEADSARSIYEENFGPLCSYRSMSNEDQFKWIDNPWPWQDCFNYNLKGENC